MRNVRGGGGEVERKKTTGKKTLREETRAKEDVSILGNRHRRLFSDFITKGTAHGMDRAHTSTKFIATGSILYETKPKIISLAWGGC